MLVVGGGAFAAAAAWEAALRGYSVALIEANDFGSGTSANSFKFVHGGIRYLQHLDFERLRASCRERSALLRVAPHLVKPMPVAIPTYGYGRNGKGFLGAGFLTYDLLTMDRNRGIADAARHVPFTRFMSRAEVLRRFEGVTPEGLTGAALFADAQMYHPPRLVFCFVQSAAERGAVVANYLEARSLLRKGDRITGAIARDRISGEEFEIRSRVVLNAAGPWSENLLGDGMPIPGAGVYSRDTCFLIDGAPEPDCAVALQGSSVDTGAIIGRAARHLFVVPWRGRRLIGVWHIVYRKGADAVEVGEDELRRFLQEFNASFAFGVRREDIRMVNAGLVPFGESDATGQKLEFGKRSHIVDSRAVHGVDGLVTLIGVRHTMARGDACLALDLIDRKLKRRGKAPDSAWEPLVGGAIANFNELARRTSESLAGTPAASLGRELAALYGTRAEGIVERARATGGLERLGQGEILAAQAELAVEQEMAVTLGDLVFRRTPVAAAGHPGDPVLEACAEAMARKLGWSEQKKRSEIESVLRRFPSVNHAGRISEAGEIVAGAARGRSARVG